MVKFASALGIGPKYHKKYSYDILVLKNHCEFLMEFCEEKKLSENEEERSKESKDLLEGLAILHSFQAVHMDIKPENIAYSTHQHKFVLIDFGFAELIKEGIGYKTLTKPKGTYYYMNK